MEPFVGSGRSTWTASPSLLGPMERPMPLHGIPEELKWLTDLMYLLQQVDFLAVSP